MGILIMIILIIRSMISITQRLKQPLTGLRWSCNMSSKPAGYLFLVAMLFFIYCAIDPVKVDTNRAPEDPLVFRSNDLTWITPIRSNRFYAISTGQCFLITPDSADLSGSIVHPVFTLGYRSLRLFENETQDLMLAAYDGFYRIDSLGYPVIEYEFQDSYEFYGDMLTVDWKGQCRYLRRTSGSKLGIAEYRAGSEFILVDSCSDPDSTRRLFFAAADNRYAVAWLNDRFEYRINMYVNSQLEREFLLFEEKDSAYIKNLFYIGTELQVMCYLQKYFEFKTEDQKAKTLRAGINFLSIGSGGALSAKIPWTLRGSTDYWNRTFYRSSRETWLWNYGCWFVATPDSIVQYPFRQTSINCFNVLCFHGSSAVLFFDEATQRFISRK
jgi:hypothetical protein